MFALSREAQAHRLVTKHVRPGQVASRSATSGAASMTCSKLSSTSRSSRSRKKACTRSTSILCPVSRRPSTSAMTEVTKNGSVIDASGTKATPSGKSAAADAATLSASRVLPTPPGPVSVRSGTSSRRSCPRIIATSRSLPMSGGRDSGSREWRPDARESVMAIPREYVRASGMIAPVHRRRWTPIWGREARRALLSIVDVSRLISCATGSLCLVMEINPYFLRMRGGLAGGMLWPCQYAG
jgi:hypothetical protein